MKTSNREPDQRAKSPETKRRGSILNSFLAGVATVLALLALGVGGFLLYRAMQSGEVSNPLNPQANKDSASVPPSTEVPVTQSPEVAVKQNPYVQLALGNKAQVELLSVTRVPGKPDEVNVQMRVHRLSDTFAGSDVINVGATVARNPIGNETYQAVDSVKRSSGPIFLFNMKKDRPVDGYVALKVPPGINLIDISVKDTGTFKNVLVSDVNPVTGVEILPSPQITLTPGATDGSNSSSLSPSSKTPSPQITIIPGATATDGSSNSAIDPSAKTPASQTTPTPGATATDGSNNSSLNPASKTPTPQASASVNGTTALAPTTTPDFKPGEFQQLAYGAKAQVELLSVKRIKDPQTGNRDVVNVQMRIRPVGDKITATNIIGVGETTARNPVTSETYKAVNPRQHSTGAVSLSEIRSGASVDAYVWLRVPPGVQTLDIFIPETGAFQQVPISNF